MRCAIDLLDQAIESSCVECAAVSQEGAENSENASRTVSEAVREAEGILVSLSACRCRGNSAEYSM